MTSISTPPGGSNEDDGSVGIAVACANVLGEGALWSAEEHALYWVDIERAELWRFVPEDGAAETPPEPRTWRLPERIAAATPRRDGGSLIVALATGIAAFDPATGQIERLADVEARSPHTRLNDARCDRQGRFLVGGHVEHGSALTALYRFDHDLTVTAVLAGISTANSICFAPDGRTLYFADSPRREILAYDYDPATGAVGGGRVFCRLGEHEPGVPDGSTVDAEGYLWNARWGGACLARYAPDGTLDRIVRLPVSQPTCPAFGGDDLGTLYVTSARQGLSAERLAAEPAAGSVLRIRPGVRGLPEMPFAG